MLLIIEKMMQLELENGLQVIIFVRCLPSSFLNPDMACRVNNRYHPENLLVHWFKVEISQVLYLLDFFQLRCCFLALRFFHSSDTIYFLYTQEI